MADISSTEAEISIQSENKHTEQSVALPKFPGAFWLLGVGIAWAADLLFWEQRFGISFGIWVLLILGASIYLANREEKKIPAASIVLMLAILATGALAVLRMEPVTRFVNVMASLSLIVLLSITFLDGYWLHFRVMDAFIKSLSLFFISGITGAAKLFSATQKKVNLGNVNHRKTFWKTAVVPVLRGILLAVPVLLVFTALLSSADPIFSDYALSFLNIFKIDNLGEYTFRLFYILMFGYIFTGFLLHGVLETGNGDRPDPKKPWMTPFLGWIETSIILYAVDLLFVGFVGIQFRYFFGGESNIHTMGYTYAEYARRGATELIFVAVLALMLYLTLKTISKHQEQKRAFSLGATALFGLVLVILVSSYQRLLLYEEAYGFTEIRTRTHIFIFWLAGLLVATAVLEIIRHSERFFLALLTACLGFSLTLGLINVEGFIVQKNVERTYQSKELDISYLNRLTSDAVPQLIHSYHLPGLDTKTKDQLGAELACRNHLLSEQADTRWISYNPSEVTAKRLLAEQKGILEEYEVVTGSSALAPVVKIQGEDYSCYTEQWLD